MKIHSILTYTNNYHTHFKQNDYNVQTSNNQNQDRNILLDVGTAAVGLGFFAAHPNLSDYFEKSPNTASTIGRIALIAGILILGSDLIKRNVIDKWY